ncbi:ATP-binding protein [Kitasatospora sp. SUK 42]|uniref:ATP-binding protein n=1 Tax=Kitasatospora sp. SUK 42 TaxID=1588882 RepID=UPI0035AB9FEE
MSNACRYARPLGPLPALVRGSRTGLVDQLLVGVPSGTHSPTGGREHEEDAAEPDGGVLVRWQMHADGVLTLEVTDGGATTRPLPASPSLTSRGGRGLDIVDQLASDWGVRDAPGEVTVWAALPARARHARRTGGDARSA